MYRKLLVSACVLLLVLLFAVVNSVSIENAPLDSAYLNAVSKTWNLPANADSIHASFESEISFLDALQDSVLNNIETVEVEQKYFGNLSFYFTHKKGVCFDRAVLMEKFFLHYGFPFRHLYLYYGSDNGYPPVLNLLKRTTESHALLEVKTKKGWMVIGTNANWMGLSKNMEPMTIGMVREEIGKMQLALQKEATMGACFWHERQDRFRYVYGLYSRHGKFFTRSSLAERFGWFPSFHFLPDYNFRMLLYNF